MDYTEKHAKEEAEKQSRRKVLDAVALHLRKVDFGGESLALIVNETPNSWDLNLTLRTASGRGLYLHSDPRDRVARLNISGVYPSYEHRFILPKERPSISVALDREPKAIEAEIRRRFLPGYLNGYQEALDIIQQKSAGKSKIVEAGIKLAALVKDRRFDPEKLDSNSSVTVTGWANGEHHFALHTGSGDDFSLKADTLSWAQVEAIVKILNPQDPEWRR
jgi:hypothetical protein